MNHKVNITACVKKLVLGFVLLLCAGIPCSAQNRVDSLKVTCYKLVIMEPDFSATLGAEFNLAQLGSVDGCSYEKLAYGYQMTYLVRCTRPALLEILSAFRQEGMLVRNVAEIEQ